MDNKNLKLIVDIINNVHKKEKINLNKIKFILKTYLLLNITAIVFYLLSIFVFAYYLDTEYIWKIIGFVILIWSILNISSDILFLKIDKMIKNSDISLKNINPTIPDEFATTVKIASLYEYVFNHKITNNENEKLNCLIKNNQNLKEKVKTELVNFSKSLKKQDIFDFKGTAIEELALKLKNNDKKEYFNHENFIYANYLINPENNNYKEIKEEDEMLDFILNKFNKKETDDFDSKNNIEFYKKELEYIYINKLINEEKDLLFIEKMLDNQSNLLFKKFDNQKLLDFIINGFNYKFKHFNINKILDDIEKANEIKLKVENILEKNNKI